MIIFKIISHGGRGTLCMGWYRPPSQGIALVDFIVDNLDRLMTVHQCENIIILGDLNPPGINNTFNSLLATFDLTNHITFPTHRSGSSLGPIVTDFPPPLKCTARPRVPPLPSLPVVAGTRLTPLFTNEAEVRVTLNALEDTEAVGPDGVSPRVLRRCSGELVCTLTKIFKATLRHNIESSEIRLLFEGTTLAPQEEMKILGVTYDSKLTFRTHITQLARTAAGKLASLRRISCLLDARGHEFLYKSQVHSSLEYSCLA
ncbi:hypothetical protein E2C01_057121 [Portunus trituberculatus]|uniref:Endonuclease/exonuclease/phosphatase domain-containing protein n=1 Tax=Portunus trituberculatus TaxID=210409 RepID=A0A5B7GZJ1_PORTR|nr:hypothetical protein [Portunus trituberculatus]